MEHNDRCPGIETSCPRAGRWLWTHRRGIPERYCLNHVTLLLAELAEKVAIRMEARNHELTAMLERRTDGHS